MFGDDVARRLTHKGHRCLFEVYIDKKGALVEKGAIDLSLEEERSWG